MSLTADTADAIIKVDKALEKYEALLNRLSLVVPEASNFAAEMAPEWAALKMAIEGLQETACGEGMHFDSVDEARQFRYARGHEFIGNETCDYKYSGEYRCGLPTNEHI